MPYVGYTSVSNQANTTDGFAAQTSARNALGTGIGEDVGDDGVVDLYGATPVATFFVANETAPGYVLQEDNSKIVLEAA